ncbi:hypothetical protein L7F22_022728 [Adiantum nelumboides]|nr:hypothetical protein [Adiantum nelumboides]
MRGFVAQFWEENGRALPGYKKAVRQRVGQCTFEYCQPWFVRFLRERETCCCRYHVQFQYLYDAFCILSGRVGLVPTDPRNFIESVDGFSSTDLVREIIQEYHFYISDDRLHSAQFVQHCFGLHDTFLQSRGATCAARLIWSDGCGDIPELVSTALATATSPSSSSPRQSFPMAHLSPPLVFKGGILCDTSVVDAATQEGSSSGKDTEKEPKIKVAIKPPTPREYSREEAEILQRWGLTVLEEASRLPPNEELIKQAANSFNKKTNTAIINNMPIQLTPAIIEYIFNVPNAPIPKPFTGEQISQYLKENTEKKQKRKAGGQGIATNHLPKQKAYKFAVEAIGLKNHNTYILEKLLEMLLAREFKPKSRINLYIYQATASSALPPPRPLAITLTGEPPNTKDIGAGKRLLKGPTDLPGSKRIKLIIKPPIQSVLGIMPLTKPISVDISDTPVRSPAFIISDFQTEEEDTTMLMIKRNKLQQLQKDSVKGKFVMDNQINPTLTYNAPTSRFMLDNETIKSLNDSGVLAIQIGWNTIVNGISQMMAPAYQAPDHYKQKLEKKK